MATFYENAGLCCMPSRRRSVFLWLDYNVLKVSNGIHSRHLHHQYRTGNHRRHPHHHRHLRPCRPHRSDQIIRRYQSLLWPPQTAGWNTHTVSVSASRERRRRRRSRHRDSHRRRSRSRSHHRRPLGRPANAGSRLTIAPSRQSTHRQSRPCRRADHLVFHMTVDGLPAAKGPQHIDVRMSC